MPLIELTTKQLEVLIHISGVGLDYIHAGDEGEAELEGLSESEVDDHYDTGYEVVQNLSLHI